ncbi:MAG: hypothetical protein ACMUHM_00800 [Thermoplasmatota archaeon]
MRDDEEEDEVWESNSLLIWTLIAGAAILTLIFIWAAIRFSCYALAGAALLLGLIVILAIMGRRKMEKERWFKKLYLKELTRFPGRTFIGVLPEHIRRTMNSSSFDFGINQWWVSIERRGHTIYTGTFFRSVPSMGNDDHQPPEYHLCAVMELPLKGRHVSLTKNIDLLSLPRRLGISDYRYGNKYFEDNFTIVAEPKDEGHLILTGRVMDRIMNSLNDCELYIGDGLLIVSDRISELYLYQSAKNPDVDCILYKWNDSVPDKMIDLSETLLDRDPKEVIIAAEVP